MMNLHETVVDDGQKDLPQRQSAPRRNFLVGIIALLLLSCSIMFIAGCSGSGEGFLVVDQGARGYSGMDTSMGTDPDGKMVFSLVAADDALENYQAQEGEDVTVDDMYANWMDALTKVTVDGKELTRKPFSEWESELESPEDDADKLLYYDIGLGEEGVEVTLPVALFDTFDSNDVSTKTFSVEAEGFDPVEGDVSFHKDEPTEFVIRVLDKPESMDGTVLEEYTVSDEALKSLSVQTGYETPANCGCKGLRSFYSDGVYLTDVLDEAGVEFTKGETLELRTGGEGPADSYGETDDVDDADTDVAETETGNGMGGSYNEQAAKAAEEAAASYYSPEYDTSRYNSAGDDFATQGSFTYDELLGTERYYYPAMWDDETVYDELGGRTVYEVLSTDQSAWHGDDEQARALRSILSDSKVAVSPIIAWEANSGVVGSGGVDPSKQTYGSNKINPYSKYSTYNLRYGIKTDEDGLIYDEFTYPNNNMSIIGVDIYPTQDKDK